MIRRIQTLFDRDNFKINSLIIGSGLLSIPAFSLLVTSLFFVCGLSINPFIFPFAVAMSMFLIFFYAKKNKENVIVPILCFLCIVAFSLIISIFFYDYSWDGRNYHQDIILQLKNGWNPIYEHHAVSSHPGTALWNNHYTKGLETIYATIYSTMGDIEAGKAVGFILVSASIFLFFHYLKKEFQFLSRRKKIFLAVLFALCPVLICQILTYYIDYVAYSLILILIPVLICYEKEQSKIYLAIICVIVFLSATIKFNLLFWICFVLLIYFIYLYFKHKQILLNRLFFPCVVSGLFAIFVASFNPYITNMIDHGNPMYPLMGEGKIDIMTGQTPDIFKDKSRFESVFISLFSQPGSDEYAFPVIYKSYFEGIQVTDMRIGGFGGFFSWTLILSTLLYFAVIFHKKDIFDRKRLKYDIVLLMLFVSLFILPSGWWARYFPFFYAFPLIMCLYFEQEQDKNNISFLNYKNIIYVLLLTNTIGMFCGSYKAASWYKKEVDKTIAVLSKSKEPILINFGDNLSFKIKLNEKKIEYNETSEQIGTKLLLGFGDKDVILPGYILENDFLTKKKK